MKCRIQEGIKVYEVVAGGCVAPTYFDLSHVIVVVSGVMISK